MAATVFGWRQGEGHGQRDGANSGLDFGGRGRGVMREMGLQDFTCGHL